MDQALYAKATEIACKHKERFSNIPLKMETFHIICNALAILGNGFRDAVLKDICIEAGIVAEGSINGVLDGKHYNRAVRVHKYIHEVLMRLAWAEFTQWVEDNVPERSGMIKSFLDNVKDKASDLTQQELNNLLQSPLLAELITVWTDSLEHLHHDNGELFTFLMSYIAKVEDIVIGVLYASREGDWELHLHAIRTMIPMIR